jgi:hypothetical protein
MQMAAVTAAGADCQHDGIGGQHFAQRADMIYARWRHARTDDYLPFRMGGNRLIGDFIEPLHV